MSTVKLNKLLGIDPNKIVVLDTETTGLNKNGNDEAVSLGMVDGNGNVLIDTLLKPRKKRSWASAQKIHGISPTDVKNAPHLDDIKEELIRYIESADLVIGYNLQFDERILGINVPLDKTFDVMFEYATVHGKSRRKGPGHLWSKLTVCAAHYGYCFKAHGALEDAKATLYCYKHLLKDVRYLIHKTADDLPGLGCLGLIAGAIIGIEGVKTFLLSFLHIADGEMFLYMIKGLLILLLSYAIFDTL